MRKSLLKILIASLGVLSFAGLTAGVTYASFSAAKNYEFNPADESVTIHDVRHYFDASSGTGLTSGSPYVISSPAHLRNLAKLTNMGVFGTSTHYHFKLSHSFNWSGDPMEPIGKDSTTPFYGYFHGDCNTIAGLKVTATGAFAGMFGYVTTASAGGIENLILSGPTITCSPGSASNVTAGLAVGYVAGTTSNVVRGVMIYGGNEHSVDGSEQELVSRAKFITNANVTLTSSASSKSIIVGGVEVSGSLDSKISFAAHMSDISTSGSLDIASRSTQSPLTSQAGSYTYSYYRNTNGAIWAGKAAN